MNKTSGQTWVQKKSNVLQFGTDGALIYCYPGAHLKPVSMRFHGEFHGIKILCHIINFVDMAKREKWVSWDEREVSSPYNSAGIVT